MKIRFAKPCGDKRKGDVITFETGRENGILRIKYSKYHTLLINMIIIVKK